MNGKGIPKTFNGGTNPPQKNIHHHNTIIITSYNTIIIPSSTQIQLPIISEHFRSCPLQHLGIYPGQGQYLPRAPAFVSRTPLRRIGRHSSKRQMDLWNGDPKQKTTWKAPIILWELTEMPKNKFRLIVDEVSEMPDML